MSIYEYNEEFVKKVLLEDGYQQGKMDTLAKAVDGIRIFRADQLIL